MGSGPSWTRLQDALQRRLDARQYGIWAQQMRCLHDDGATLRIGLPDRFSRDWVSDHYAHVLEDELGSVTLEIVVAPAFAADESKPSTPSEPEPSDPVDVDSARQQSALNESLTFDSFVVGESNQLANSAARSVAETRSFSPLVIVGGVGLGKTHLLHAIGHAASRRNPKPRVLLKTSEAFLNDVVGGIQKRGMDKVRRRYRTTDFLLIDDIQFLAGKSACQDELFHTFDALDHARKQIVLTSDQLPSEIGDIEARIRSRFMAGLIAVIDAPNLATRTEIVCKTAAADGIVLSDDVAMLIARSVRSSVRELRGALISVIAHASLTRQPITVELALRVLDATFGSRRRALTCSAIADTVARYFDVEVSTLKSAKRDKSVVFARRVAMFLCRQLLGASFPAIGRAFGGRDHTTVIAACKAVTESVGRDLHVRSQVEEIEGLLGSPSDPSSA